MKLATLYGGSGAVNVQLPTGNVFKARFVSHDPHKTDADVDNAIVEAVRYALAHGQHNRVLKGGSTRQVDFDRATVIQMQIATERANEMKRKCQN